MNNTMKFLARDYSSAFSFYFKYTLLAAMLFLFAMLIPTGDFLFLAIFMLSYICSYVWVNSDHDSKASVFLNFLPASAKSYVAAKYLFLLTAILPFVAIAFIEMYFLRDYMHLQLPQIVNMLISAYSLCLLFGGLTFLGVFIFGTEKYKYVYCAPVFIGALLSFAAPESAALASALDLFTNNLVNCLILMAVSILVYIITYFVSAKKFSFDVLMPSFEGWRELQAKKK